MVWPSGRAPQVARGHQARTGATRAKRARVPTDADARWEEDEHVWPGWFDVLSTHSTHASPATGTPTAGIGVPSKQSVNFQRTIVVSIGYAFSVGGTSA